MEKFRAVLPEAMALLTDDKIRDKVARVLKIWAEREVYEEKFVHELTLQLQVCKVFILVESHVDSIPSLQPTAEASKEAQEIIDNFQPTHLCTQLKILKALEDDRDYKLRTLSEQGKINVHCIKWGFFIIDASFYTF